MKVLFSLLCLTTLAWAQTQSAPQPFSAQLYNIAAPDSSRSRLLVALAILHDDLSFAKNDSGFAAHYELALAVTNNAGDWVAGREEQKRIHVRAFEETNSRRKYSAHDYYFDLPPGKYRVALSFTDRVSGACVRKDLNKELQAFSSGKKRLALSDIILLDGLVTDSLQRLVLTPGLFENTTTPEGELHLYLEMFGANPNEPLRVEQTLRNWKQQTVVNQKRDWPRRARVERLVLPLGIEVLPYGVYEIEMKVQHGKTEMTVRENFHLTWNGIPASGVHLDQALSAAEYIAAPSEREQLQTALREYTKEQKREMLRSFWQRRDDTPDTSELEAMNVYYQRIELANKNFSAGRQEGWQTDLGKTFVNFGAPDDVQLFDGNTPAAQILVWQYRRFDRRFSFLDFHGTGDFRLMSR